MSNPTGKGLKVSIVVALSVILGLFHLYTSAFGIMTPMLQRPIHLSLVLLIIVLSKPLKSRTGKIIDYLIVAGIVTVAAYNISIYDTLNDKMGIPNQIDVYMGILLVVLLLELTRRSTGWALPIVGLVGIAYIYIGPHLPGVLSHPGYPTARLISQLYLGTEGIWGIALSVSATYLALFVFFGSFLQASGGGQLFVDASYAIAGKYRGGPAKTAVLASGLMGSISGSPVANVVTTGAFTIPLMKKVGYSPKFAGAVEAVASSGGSLMPPIMGAGAFVMAEMTGIPYVTIIVAAIMPALLYYGGVFLCVDFQAGKLGLEGHDKSSIPKLGPLLKAKGYLLLPLLIMIYFLAIERSSPIRAGFYSIVAMFVVSWFSKVTRLNLTRFVEALKEGSKGLGPVATACAMAGVVTGVISLSGVGLKLTQLIVSASDGNLFIALLLTMLSTIVMGMALPPTATYIIIAALGAPALTNMGLEVIQAHMFIFFFSVVAPITPPVALAAYAASGLSGGDPMKTGIQAFLLGLSGFIVPYVLAYDPALLMVGSPIKIIIATTSALVGIFFLAQGVIGWFRRKYSAIIRLILIVAAITLIIPGVHTDAIGLAIGIVGMFLGGRFGKRTEVEAGVGR